MRVTRGSDSADRSNRHEGQTKEATTMRTNHDHDALPGPATLPALLRLLDVHLERREYVNMLDMGHADDAPLGYLLYRVQAALRPEVRAALSPLGLTLP